MYTGCAHFWRKPVGCAGSLLCTWVSALEMTVRAIICASVTSSHGHRCNRLCLCHLMGASDYATFSVTQERQTVSPVWLLVGALLFVRGSRTGAVRELKGGSSILLSCKKGQIIHPLSVDKWGTHCRNILAVPQKAKESTMWPDDNEKCPSRLTCEWVSMVVLLIRMAVSMSSGQAFAECLLLGTVWPFQCL